MRFEYATGVTPIDPDKAKGLIPAHLTSQRELNEYEESNIRGSLVAAAHRPLSHSD